jgi:hypothetical protein
MCLEVAYWVDTKIVAYLSTSFVVSYKNCGQWRQSMPPQSSNIVFPGCSSEAVLNDQFRRTVHKNERFFSHKNGSKNCSLHCQFLGVLGIWLF